VIKVLICDDQIIVCEGLTKILSSDPDIRVVAVAHDGSEALDLVSQYQPDLVLMDLKMPLVNGVVATRKIHEHYPSIPVLVLTTYDDDEWLFDAIRSGAAGYLLKDTTPKNLIESIKGTVIGQTFLDPDVAGKLLGNYSMRPPARSPSSHVQLSEREQDLLQLMTRGLNNSDIAQQLYLTEGTVRNYTSELFKKLGVSDRTQAVVVALRYGLVDLDDL
jgi:DNA-binding NarL/FixJ family response regulator